MAVVVTHNPIPKSFLPRDCWNRPWSFYLRRAGSKTGGIRTATIIGFIPRVVIRHIMIIIGNVRGSSITAVAFIFIVVRDDDSIADPEDPQSIHSSILLRILSDCTRLAIGSYQ